MKFVVEFEARKLPRFAAHYLAFSPLHRLACEAAEASRGGGGGGGAASPPRALSGRLKVSAEEAAAASARFAAALHAELMRIDGFVAAQRAAIVAERQAALRARNAGRAYARELVLDERRLWHAAAELRDFCELNYAAVYKLVKKVDKELGSNLLATTLWMVEQMPWLHVLDIAGSSDAAAVAAAAAGGGSDAGSVGGATASDGDDAPPPPPDGGGGDSRFAALVDTATAGSIATLLRAALAAQVTADVHSDFATAAGAAAMPAAAPVAVTAADAERRDAGAKFARMDGFCT
jgi:hypothetical protein